MRKVGIQKLPFLVNLILIDWQRLYQEAYFNPKVLRNFKISQIKKQKANDCSGKTNWARPRTDVQFLSQVVQNPHLKFF